MKAIVNARAFVPDTIDGSFCERDDLCAIFDEKIRALVPYEQIKNCTLDKIIDVQGRYLAPGFINVHIHGADGQDTMDALPDTLSRIGGMLTSTGVTAFCPTTMTAPWGQVEQALSRIQRAMQANGDGAQVLGAHLEGPFISAAQKGAQAEENILSADWHLIAPWTKVIRLLTLAPEELPDKRFIEECQRSGIRVSLGHTNADFATAKRAICEYGVKHITHVFNAMSPFHHRNSGVTGAALDTDADCELIADNVHTSPAAQRLLYRAKSGKHIILITDSLRACGIGDGDYDLGGQTVHVQGELATLADGTLAGSVAKMNRCVRLFWENTQEAGATLASVIEFATRTPAEALGVYAERGSLSVGKRADFTVFDEGIEIFSTWIGGSEVYARA